VIPDGDNFLDRSEVITCTAEYGVRPADVPPAASAVTNTAYAVVQGVRSNEDTVVVPWYNSTAVTLTAVRTAGPFGLALGAGIVLALGGVVLAAERRRRRTG
jgi:hypothetical protein